MTSVAEMGEESREHSFQLIYQSHGIWRIYQLNTSYIAKNAEMSCKTPGTIPVNKYLLSKHAIGIRKNPVKDWKKNQKITSYHLKNMEKLWVNVSFQSRIVLGVKHQRAGNFKTMKEGFPKTIPLWSPKNEVPCNGKR